MKHSWKTDDFGKVDNFAFEHENHNGPACAACGKSFCEHCAPECYDADDCDPVNIDLALAQIAEMEKNQVLSEIIDSIENPKPLTWNERINQMTVEEKIKFLMSFENCANSVNPSFKCYESIDCDECLAKFLNSPYTEGEKE